MKRIFLIMAMMGTVTSVKAAFFTGNDIFSYCSSNRTIVSGFVAGAFDKGESDSDAFFAYMLNLKMPKGAEGAQFGEQFSDTSNSIQQYCTPKSNVVLTQVTDIFCQFLATNPATRHYMASSLLNNALTKAWPCALSKPK